MKSALGVTVLIPILISISSSCSSLPRGKDAEKSSTQAVATRNEPRTQYKFETLLTGNDHTFCADSNLTARILTQDIVDPQAEKFMDALDRYKELNEARILAKGVPVKYVREMDYDEQNIVLRKFLLVKPTNKSVDACWVTAAMIEAKFVDTQTRQLVTVRYGENPNNSKEDDDKSAWRCYAEQTPCYPTE